MLKPTALVLASLCSCPPAPPSLSTPLRANKAGCGLEGGQSGAVLTPRGGLGS